MKNEAIESPQSHQNWDCWAPVKGKNFSWFAVADRCWTADRIAWQWHGVKHSTACPLCDWADETICHFHTRRAFAQQVSFKVFSEYDVQAIASLVRDDLNGRIKILARLEATQLLCLRWRTSWPARSV